MNRRGFFKSLAATAMVAVATHTRVGQFAARIAQDPVAAGRTYLARSLLETKEMLTASILNRAFEQTWNV